MANSEVPQAPTNTDAGSIRLVDVENDAIIVDQADIASNADLYAITPPAYTQSIAEGERSVDAEATRDEKSPLLPQQQQQSSEEIAQELERTADALRAPSITLITEQGQPQHHAPPSQPITALQNVTPTQPAPSPPVSHYLTQPYTEAALVGIRSCSVLHDRPAIWLLKRKKVALCALVAAVLIKEGLIIPKDLELITQHAAARRDPTDPLSGLLLGTYDVVGEMMLGLVAGPVELGRQSTLAILQKASRDGVNIEVSPIKPTDVPRAAGKVALESGKGLGRIVTASLKSPAILSHGITRGFHNIPKLYGEKVRDYENVTGFRSGLKVSGKSFGYGLSDGFIDLFAKPVQGAEENGFAGFTAGVGKGIGNAVMKPAAGAFGLVGYSTLGVYKSIRKIKLPPGEKVDNAALVESLGGEEYEQASDGDRLYIVRYWCQTMMRSRY